VLMDTLHERLKDLILFLNERSRFTVYAVSMEFYRHEGFEIVIPKLFGAERRSALVGQPKAVDEQTFFEDAKRHLSEEELTAVRSVYEFAKQSGAGIDWGRGLTRGSFSPKYPHISRRSLFTVTSKGKLRLNFGWLNDTSDAMTFRSRYVAAMRGLQQLPPAAEDRRPALENWHERADDFIKIMIDLVKAP